MEVWLQKDTLLVTVPAGMNYNFFIKKKKNIYIYIYIYIHTHTYTHSIYIYIYIYIYIRGGTVHVFVPNRHGTGISVRCMMPYDEYRQFPPQSRRGHCSSATVFDNHQQKNSECQRWHRGGRADVWLTVFYSDKVPTGCQVSNAGTDVCARVRVRACARECVCVWRDHFNCFLIPAESTLNTYCLINNHCIKVCFYLWKQNGFYIYNM